MNLLINFIFSFILFVALSLFQAFCLTLVIDNGSQVVIRDLLFTKIYTEHELEGLHKKLDEINYSNYDGNKLQNLHKQLPVGLINEIEFSNNLNQTMHEKVLYIIEKFSPSLIIESSQCIVDDPLETTRRIYNSGEGCCSDYAKSAIIILNIMGIKAREINNNRHTAIEYFNSDTNSWIWIDPSYRLYAKNHNGEKLSAEGIFLSRYNEINYIKFSPRTLEQFSSFDDNKFHKPNQNNALFYSLESVDPPLRDRLIKFGISPAVIDLLFQITNMREGKLVLMPYGFQSIIFNFAQYSAYLIIFIGLAFNLLISFIISAKIANNTIRTFKKNSAK